MITRRLVDPQNTHIIVYIRNICMDSYSNPVQIRENIKILTYFYDIAIEVPAKNYFKSTKYVCVGLKAESHRLIRSSFQSGLCT